MNQVISLREALRARRSSTLVLVDLHEQADCDIESNQEVIAALTNCRAALSHARACGMQVAFVRSIAEAQLFNTENDGPRWLPGFMPRRSEMIFDRDRPSCYASTAFADVMKGTNSQYALAGLFGESACLSTVIDGFHRNHRLTYLADASASHATGNMRSSEVHRMLAGIISQYSSVIETRHWIQLTEYARLQKL
jgi:nicotinamidase-related amidase